MILKTVNKLLNMRPVMHLVFWTLFVFTGSFITSYQQSFPYVFYLLNFLVHLPVFLLFTYGVIYFLVPVLLFKRAYWQFFVSLAVAAATAAILRIFIGKYVYYSLFIPKVLHPREWFNPDIFLLNLIWILGPAILFAMFKYYKNYMNTQTLAAEAERKQLSSELQLLKAQLNPHFLFNTFNNLYVLALQNSPKTPVVISKMSDLFHYVLYECNANEVPVSKEIKLIEDYIQLEELRYSDRLTINVKKEIENPEYLIPPMMLYTFVENCFKHGSSPDPGSSWINLHIKVRGNIFEFEAVNSIPKSNCQSTKIEGGVGLTNIKRRLELIYPEKHQLEIRKDKCTFLVSLKIQKNIQQNQN